VDPTVTAHVLGTAQDGGNPQFGTASSVGPARTASSVAIVDDAGRALLLDASPDLRLQQRRLRDGVPAYAARLDPAPFDGVAITHAHMGHYSGLVHFGKEALGTTAVPLWVTPALAGFLRANQPWRTLLDDGNLDVRVVDPGVAFAPWPGLEVTPVAVPHRGEHSDTVAFSVRTAGMRLLYLPDIDAWEPWPEATGVIAGHDVALLDGTFFSGDELPHRDMAAVAHPLVPDTLERFGHLTAGRRLVITHLNHTNPAADPSSPAAAAVTAAGFTVAEEMQAIALGARTR
jgi:pyrroloquinoline quinone biosynthesis protein B